MSMPFILKKNINIEEEISSIIIIILLLSLYYYHYFSSIFHFQIAKDLFNIT